MKPEVEIEFRAVVEKLEISDLQQAAALIFREWCLDQGTSTETALKFFATIIEVSPDQVSEDLGSLASTLRRIRD
ncbi:MAG: hypothetical protein KME20_27510 [Kaiparowitsia implicata GSE-PSE-MK54-09C]|jgi:hypothetical protein|nr:hypothetical protein [Kaiparowitsia implicata GSE-PSE-MK54-09C]